MKLSIRWKLILAIGVPLLLVYAVMVFLMVNQLRARNLTRLENEVEEIASHYAARFDSRFRRIAQLADTSAAAIAAGGSWSKEGIYRLLESDLEYDSVLHGSRAVFLAERGLGAGATVQYVRRTDDRLLRVERELPAASPDPTPWLVAARAGRAGWTEPFDDPSAEGRTVSAYVAPVVENGRTVAAVVVDVASDTLQERAGAIAVQGGEGDFTILSREGRFVSTPPASPGVEPLRVDDTVYEIAERFDRPEFAELGRRATAGETGVARAEGLVQPGRRWMLFAPIESTGWSFIAIVPEEVLLEFSQSQLRLGLGLLLGGLVVILFLLWLMATRITTPLARLASAVRGLGSGDLDTRVSGVTTRDEIGDLAQAFNGMVADLKHHVDALTRETAAREAVESELRVARKIQTSLLPRKFPERSDLAIHAVNIPAKEVAGDFFDFFFLDDDTFVFLIADVSGKGVPAALFMAMARTVLRQVAARPSVTDSVVEANDVLEANNVGSMYITLFMGWYHLPTRTLRYVNGGHPPPYRIDVKGTVEAFGEVCGPVVGLLPMRTYAEGKETLAPGDRLVLFTDGVPEAEAPDGEFFGDDRFRRLLGDLASETVDGLCQRVAETVDEYEAGSPHDDVTVVVFEAR